MLYKINADKFENVLPNDLKMYQISINCNSNQYFVYYSKHFKAIWRIAP